MAAQDIKLLQTLINKTIEGSVEWRPYSMYDPLPVGTVLLDRHTIRIDFVRSTIGEICSVIVSYEPTTNSIQIYRRRATEDLVEELIEVAQGAANGYGMSRILEDLRSLET